ncbi:hypothetical protein [Salininema proteolyticum]|uniref:Uncharacterized protein n=1 Tax=Salininema proteolyticum TaxID=1607685 RepID=A0ABV8U505_9ACTN
MTDLRSLSASDYVGPRLLSPEDGDPADWFTLTELYEGPVRDHMRAFSERSQAPADTTAAYFTGWIAGLYIRPAVWAWTRHRVLPDYDPDRIAARLNAGHWYDAVSLGEGRDLSGHAPDVARKALAEAVKGLGTDLVAAIGPHARLGNRALWAHVTDTFATAFLPRPPLGEEAVTAAAEADRILAAASFPTPGPRWIHYEGATTSVGQSCCLSYKVPGDSNCAPVCPKIKDEDRPADLAAWRDGLPDRKGGGESCH